MNVFKRKAGIFECYLVRINRRAVRLLNDNGLRNGIRYTAKLICVLFKILNVGIRSIPVEDLARFVAQWLSPKQKPSIRSVEPTQPAFDLARLARRQKSAPLLGYFLQIFRVNGILPSPAACRFRGQPGIVVPSPIPEFSCPIRRTTPRKSRDRVNDLAEPTFGLFDLLVGPLELRL